LDSVVNGKIENNTCENNSGYGILLTSSSYNTLTNNTCLNNSGTDIILSASTNNILTNNTIDDIILVSARMDTSEGVVILVHTNFNNTIFHNYLLNNAQDDGINHWDNGSEGNYWSDWQPPAHPSSNGIVVDTPRPIASGTTLIADGTNADRYPLVLPNVITTTTTNTETTVTTTNTGTTTPPTQTDSTATPTQPWPVILASIGIAAVIVVTVAVKMHGR
jgi:parallel beta-helix repeat protein